MATIGGYVSRDIAYGVVLSHRMLLHYLNRSTTWLNLSSWTCFAGAPRFHQQEWQRDPTYVARDNHGGPVLFVIMNRQCPLEIAHLPGLSGSDDGLTMSCETYSIGHGFGYPLQRDIVVGGLAVDCCPAEHAGQQVRALAGRNEGGRAPVSTEEARGLSPESASRARRDVTPGTPGSPRLLPDDADPGTRKVVERWECRGNGQNEGTALPTHQATVRT